MKTVHFDKSNDELVEKFYNELLIPNFGLFPDELDSLDNFKLALASEFQYTLNIILLFDDDILVAGCSYEFYPKSKCSLLTYIAVSKNHQGLGLSKTLINELLNQLNQNYPDCLALLCESNSDRVKVDVMDPKVRRKVLNNIGFYFLDFDYIQPPLSSEQQKCKDLILGVHKNWLVDDSIHSDIILDWLEEFYQVLIGEDYLNDGDLTSTKLNYSTVDLIYTL
jgi:hypothetical protein